MLKSLTEKTLNFLGIENDLEIKDVIISDKIVNMEEEVSDDSNIFKIPKYLERVNLFFILHQLIINYKGNIYRFNNNDECDNI